jgi:hypothetical protein
MSEEWIETNGGLARHRNNYDESGKPAGIVGQVMPGEMAACNEHNNLELWKHSQDPDYLPNIVHPKTREYSEPSIDRDADRSGLNGIVKDVPQMQASPLEPDYRIYGRPENAPVTPMMAKYLEKEKEAKVASGELSLPDETPAEEPKEEPAEGLVPDTMPGIWKLLGFTAESFYDLGTRTLPAAGIRKPGLEGSLKMYRKNMLLTVARALLLKEYGRKLTAEQVKKSAVASWRNNGRMKKYGEAIRENQGPATVARIKAILDEVDGFMSGKVKCEAKYMIPYLGQLWCLKGFILWCKVSQGMAFKKTGWRSAKAK